MNALRMRAMNVYQQVTYESALESSDQLDMIKLLFNALIDSVVDAESHLMNRRPEAKGNAVSKAQNILLGLRATLDFEQGGEVARNLDDLYDYCLRRLTHAHVSNDQAAFREVRDLMHSIKEAWHLTPVKG
jgi:flagellar protein FliS